MTRCYATVAQMRVRLGLATTDPTTNDADYLLQLQNATTYIDRYMWGFVFEPMNETRLFDWRDPSLLVLRPHTLLATPSAALNSEGASITVGSLTGITYAQYPNGPLHSLKGASLFGTGSARYKALSITGTFGFHLDYSGAWAQLATVADGGGINSSVTTVTVADSTLFSAGMLIKIGTEYLRVTATPSATTLTVRRAENGTSAASALNGAAISAFSPMADIQELCLTTSAWLRTREYTSKDKRASSNVESDAPEEMPDMLEKMTCVYKEQYLWRA